MFPLAKDAPHGVSDHAEACLAKIKAMLAEPPKKPGRWWAHEVIARYKAGHATTLAALELAENALRHEGQRVPGEDDE